MKDIFKTYFTELIGPEEAEQFFSSIEAKKTRKAIRVNTLKTTVEAVKSWLESQGYSIELSPWCDTGLVITGHGQPLSLKLPYHSGFTYPQDESSMYGVELLDPKPGETVIDLTAAPGGKTTHMAQKMQNKGVLLANDMDSRRLKALHSNLSRLGVWNCFVIRNTPYKLAQAYPEQFDKVLLDPSCSGEGLLVRHEGKPEFWSTKASQKYAKDQFGLLCSAFQMLKPGGRLVFSTCTLNNIENEGVVQRLIERFPQAQVESVDIPTPEQIGEFQGVRFWPQKTGTKGFFCIAITKTESIFTATPPEHEPLKPLKAKEADYFYKSIQAKFGVDLPKLPLYLREEDLHICSEELIDFPLGVHPSLSFPFIKKSSTDFRLTHVGALYVGLHATKNVYECSREELELIFEHHMTPSTSPEGEYIVKYQNFPLGLGKLKKGQLTLNFPAEY